MGKKIRTKNYQRTNSKTQTHSPSLEFIRSGRMIKLGVVGMAVLVFIFQLVFSNYFATKGDELNDLERRKTELEKKKVILQENLVDLGSLERIQKDSQEKLHMVSAQGNVQYLSPENVALIQ